MTTRKQRSKSTTSRAAQAAARNTDSRGAARAPAGSADPLVQKAVAINALASAMPENTNKAAEYGRKAATRPPAGKTVAPTSATVTGSTLSESNASDKVGEGAELGANHTIGSLDRVRADGSGQRLTTNQGVPIADNQNSLKAGLRGPALLKDFVLREKITHFDHERIPERVVHARGSGAHGFFECLKPIRSLTRASLFQEKGETTPVFVRFSTVAGERGSKDTARDARGFAVKFYTQEGNWDLVGNNIPVFFIQDAMKFPDLVHAVKPEPHHAMPQAASAHDTFWDFVSLTPESAHMLMWVMSDRGIPRSYRMMQGFGVHTYRLVNDEGKSVFVKFHWNPKLGTHSLVWDEAVKISGCDPDFHRRDLWEAIEAGEYPEWELGVQVFTEKEADAFSFDVLDSTKLIPEELVPIQVIGRMVLNRNPDNFFAETEQVAFCTAHVVPGIDFSNDPLLAGRIHSYVDTQLSRLGGPNFHEIPINASVAPIANNQRDGMHRQTVNRGGVAYEPNSLAGGCPFQAGSAGFVPFPQPIADDEVRGKPEKFAEHFNQATLFFNSQTPSEQAHIAAAFRFELSKVSVPAIRERTVSMLRNVSEDLAKQVAAGLGMKLPKAMPRAIARAPRPEVTLSPALSLMARPGNGDIRTRKVAILVADGIDGKAVSEIQAALLGAGAVPRLVGPRIGPFKSASGPHVDADASLENEPGVVFDAVVVPGGGDGIDALRSDGRAIEFVKEQFRHGKPMLALEGGEALLEAASVPSDGITPGIVIAKQWSKTSLQAFTEAVAAHRHPDRETDPPLV